MPRVYRFALRLTGDVHAAEDLTQETLLRAWSRRLQLRDPRAARVWLLRIAANLWRDQARRARLPAARPEPLGEDVPSSCRPPGSDVADREELGRALAALDALPPRQREVLYLSACDGLTRAEIAEVLGVSPDAVKANLCLARQRLRRQMTEPPRLGGRVP